MVDKKTNQGNQLKDSITINKWVASGLGALALFVILHTGVLIWTLGSITTTQSHIQSDLSEIKSELQESSNDRYRRSDAKADFEAESALIANLRSDFISERDRQANIERLQWEAIRELQDPR